MKFNPQLTFQAQKPWEKKYTKLMQAKKEYHAACRSEKSTANQENNARGDSAVSPDQVQWFSVEVMIMARLSSHAFVSLDHQWVILLSSLRCKKNSCPILLLTSR